ncbi:hypothetical protein BWI92_12245 [Flectobacillus sp. BAB-3569]|nr:hypothetical protein BWI92_12245 [Flectobacillus sp. BAB-3569]
MRFYRIFVKFFPEKRYLIYKYSEFKCRFFVGNPSDNAELSRVIVENECFKDMSFQTLKI